MLARKISASSGTSAGSIGRIASFSLRAGAHRAISQVVPSLVSLSTTPILASSSRMRSDSLKFLAFARGVARLDQADNLAFVDRQSKPMSASLPFVRTSIAAIRSVRHWP